MATMIMTDMSDQRIGATTTIVTSDHMMKPTGK